jgi:hypothetical protein
MGAYAPMGAHAPMGASAFIPLLGAMNEHMLLGSILGTAILAIKKGRHIPTFFFTLVYLHPQLVYFHTQLLNFNDPTSCPLTMLTALMSSFASSRYAHCFGVASIVVAEN